MVRTRSLEAINENPQQRETGETSQRGGGGPENAPRDEGVPNAPIPPVTLNELLSTQN